MSDEFDWLEQIEDEVMHDLVHSPDFYGTYGNKYNPEIHLFCLTDEIGTIEALADKLEEVVLYLRVLKEHGWELACPVQDGGIETKHAGTPPLADSMFDENGNDL